MEKYMMKILSGVVVLAFGLIALPLVRTLLNDADFTVNTSATETVDLNFFKVIILLVYIVGVVGTSVLLFISGVRK